MPYALQEHYLPEWEYQPPEAWERRLREISPITERLSHLRFRYRTEHESWVHPDRGQWMLYDCTPRRVVLPDRAELFDTHWSQMATKGERVARENSVSSYQHFMWHVHGVDARPFWILQGEFGGTPAKYSRREKRWLDAMDYRSEELPLGAMPPCQFDERAVASIVKSDRLWQAEKKMISLEEMDRPAYKKAEDEFAEQEFRRVFLENWVETLAPQADFMRHWASRSENREELPPAPAGLANQLSQWQDHYIQHGHVIGAKIASSRRVHVAAK